MGRGIGPGRRIARGTRRHAHCLRRPPWPAIRRPASSQAVERFRAAAVLQERALYDLAAAEYEAIAREFAADPLADRARLQRGICLFQLNRYADAAAELAAARGTATALNAAESEQALAYFGLTEYNLSHAADGRAARRTARRRHRRSRKAAAKNFPTESSRRRRPIYHAEALYARGRLDEAVAAYRVAVGKVSGTPATRRRALRFGRRRTGAARLCRRRRNLCPFREGISATRVPRRRPRSPRRRSLRTRQVAVRRGELARRPPNGRKLARRISRKARSSRRPLP